MMQERLEYQREIGDWATKGNLTIKLETPVGDWTT